MTITGKARLAGVFGWPISHSKSPRMHGWWLDQYGIDGAYVPMAVRPEDIVPALRALPLLGFRGVNVTLPHKETVFAEIDHPTDRARRMGAVNTVIVEADGSLTGDNTDGFGFLENLRAGQAGFRAATGPAVVLGAGGAARAIVAALLDDGVPELRLVNRTRDKAEHLARSLGGEQGGPIRVFGLEDTAAALADAALLVNTTSLGMSGQPPLDLDLSALPESALVNDIVYVPLETDLLKAARARGNPVVDGLGMLLHQGRPGFKAWFGTDPQVSEDLRQHMLRS